MNLIKMNLLRKKEARVTNKDSNDSKNSLDKVNPHSLRDGLYISRKPVVAERTDSLIKVYTIVIISSISAFCVGYLFSVRSFAHGAFALLIFTIIFMIQTILLRKTLDVSVVVMLDALSLSSSLVATSFSIAAYSLVILSIMFVLAHMSNRREMDNMVQLKFFRAVRSGTSLLLIALSVFIGLTLFINSNILFENENVSRVINLIGKPILNNKVKDFSAEMRFDDFLKSYVKTELSNEKDFKNLSGLEQEMIASTQTDNLAIYIEARTGYKPQMSKSVTENIQEFISTKTEALYLRNQFAQLAIVVLILIITMKSIEFLLFPILAILGLMVYELLIGFGFVEIQFESRGKEVLNLPGRRS